MFLFPELAYGDADGDGAITAEDAALTLTYVRDKDLDIKENQIKAMLKLMVLL